MAFLDNSGDIILDAVLTDLGRKRMAEGNFRITQFALGDDEIDYGLYNKDHPSGSAYFDLEILQTPVFEAFTRENSNINYGLLTFDGNTDLLYLPTMIMNQKFSNVSDPLVETSGIVYFAANQQTYDFLVTDNRLLTTEKISKNNGNRQFIFETGIDSLDNDPAGGQTQRNRYIVDTGLTDNEFTLVCDGRFLSAVKEINAAGSTFNYDDGGVINANINLKNDTIPPTAAGGGVAGQRVYTLNSIPNLVVDQSGDGTAATSVSEINGPRGQVTAFNFSVSPDLETTKTGARPAKYSLYGRTGLSAADLPGIAAVASETYDIIDTIVYLNGNTTGANTQLIVRIIRQAS